MKKILLTFVLLVGIAVGLFAQKLTYQAVVRDNNQQLVVNTDVKAFVTIEFSTGTPATYKDTVNGRTNIHGLLSIEFGGDALNGRDWEGATIAVKVVNSTTTSIVYVNDGARPVSAVPYALSVNGQSIQNYLTEHHYVDLDKLKDTLNAYPTTAVMNSRHYLTSDSAVITTMQGNITTNANSIANLTLHTAKNAIRDSVAGQIHDSISNIAAKAHTHDNKDLLDSYDQTNDNLADAVTKRHAHGNADILNNTTATYTDADSIKLKGIAEGAEVNVQSDWSQADNSKDDFIKNRPSIRDTVNNILNTGGYVTETTLDSRHYLRSDSTVITTMQGNITANANNITSLQGNLSAAISKEKTDSTTLAERINALENASMDCNDVKNCIKDTLNEYTPTADLTGLLQQLTARLDAQNAKMDSLAHIVDSLSNLTPGGGDTPTTTFTCGTSKVKDADLNEYNTVKIGNQCWMAQNLRTNVDGSVYPKRGNETVTGEDTITYGRLYTWNAMMKGAPSTNYPAVTTAADTIVHGICPTGWHVPSDAEWDTLTYYVFNSTSPDYKCGSSCDTWQAQSDVSCIANALSQPTGWSNTGTGCNAGNMGDKANATGFAAVPAGYCFDGNFIDFGSYAYFWSATRSDGGFALYRYLGSFGSGVYSYSDDKGSGYSVRCLRDAGVGSGGTTPSAPATMSCEQVMECMGDTLGKLNEKIEDLNATVTTQGAEIETLNGIVTTQGQRIETLNSTVQSQGETITTQGQTIDSLAHLVDSLSNPTSGGDTLDTPDTPDSPETFTCGTSIVKDVDNNEYNTVKIGSQCWMKENMKTTRYADSTGIEANTMFNPGGSEDNVATYGKLYTWSAATRDSSTTYPAAGQVKVQGICPTGWHVPSDAEWDTLTNYVNSVADYKCGKTDKAIAKALSSTTGWRSNNTTCNVGKDQEDNNATGFSAVPTGSYYLAMVALAFGQYTYFWSATDNEDVAYYRSLHYDNSQATKSYEDKGNGYSVRCLRDLVYGGSDTPTTTFNCGTDKVKDIQNNEYSTVLIGSQCWTKENLRTKRYADGEYIELEQIHTPAIDDLGLQDIGGLLYTWSVATRDSSTTYPESGQVMVQGVCPSGWHVPSDSEWAQLLTYTQSNYLCEDCNPTSYLTDVYFPCIAKALASNTDRWQVSTNGCAVGNNPSVNNASGFSALPVGYFSTSVLGYTEDARFWSATLNDNKNTDAWGMDISDYTHAVSKDSYVKSWGYSVRCLKN